MREEIEFDAEGNQAWARFVDTPKERAPAWRNEVTLRSFEMLMEYEPGGHFDADVDHFEPAVQAAGEWFSMHLGTSAR